MQPTAVKGVASGLKNVEIAIISDADKTAAARQAEQQQKELFAAQNALPEWHTHSTVSNDITAAGKKEESARREREAEKVLLEAVEKEEDKKPDKEENAADSIYAMLKAEQEEQAKKRAEEEEYEDDEDGDEFEDVDVGASGERNGDGAPQAKRVKLDPSVGGSSAATPNPPTGNEDESDADDDEFEDVAV